MAVKISIPMHNDEYKVNKGTLIGDTQSRQNKRCRSQLYIIGTGVLIIPAFLQSHTKTKLEILTIVPAIAMELLVLRVT